MTFQEPVLPQGLYITGGTPHHFARFNGAGAAESQHGPLLVKGFDCRRQDSIWGVEEAGFIHNTAKPYLIRFIAKKSRIRARESIISPVENNYVYHGGPRLMWT